MGVKECADTTPKRSIDTVRGVWYMNNGIRTRMRKIEHQAV